MNSALRPEQRAELLAQQLTQEEKITLTQGEDFGATAGKLMDLVRFGFPPLLEADAVRGVMNMERTVPATEFPANITIAASFDDSLAETRGQFLAEEARAQGIGILLNPAGNLVRDPRGGRTSEYLGEDPLLAGNMMAACVRGIQSKHVIATVKHFAVNGWESQRKTSDMLIDEAAARESELLAFEIAIRDGKPSAVMGAYPWLNGLPQCANKFLLTDVLRRDWGFRGFVMSDWDAFQDTITSANAGLDIQSGILPSTTVAKKPDTFAGGGFNDGRTETPPGPFGPGGARPYYGELQKAIDAGDVPQARLDTMVRNILTGIFASGVVDNPPVPGPIPIDAHLAASQRQTEDGAVLLKNEDGVLPLREGQTVAIIGRVADGFMAKVPSPFSKETKHAGPTALAALRARMPANITYQDGTDGASAVAAAKSASVALVFAAMVSTEGLDRSTLSLSPRYNELIQSVAAANPNTVVVLYNANPIFMPWLSKVKAVLAAWQPGDFGGDAIANMLLGDVNPSGKLPVTFPTSVEQLPRSEIPGYNRGGLGGLYKEMVTVPLKEGAAVGYKWFNATGQAPLFPFGHGLSYTSFDYSRAHATVSDGSIKVTFVLENAGERAGREVAQVYVTPPGEVKRLGGYRKVALEAGGSVDVSIEVPKQMLARWDTGGQRWQVRNGTYTISIGGSSLSPALEIRVDVIGVDDWTYARAPSAPP